MKLCAISFKPCWQDASGIWYSSGGFPLQMAGIGSLFDEMTLLIVRCEPQQGGIPLPEHAHIVPLPNPTGQDLRRKLSVLVHLSFYLAILYRHIRQSDVVHVPLPGDLPFLGMMVALALGKPLIARYGGSWQPTNQTTVMNRVTKTLMRLFAGRRNVMLATGTGESPPARHMHWLYVTALTHQEVEQIRPVLNRVLCTPPKLAYVGRLSPEKGVENLIQALALLQDKGLSPLPHLTLIGDGTERQTLEAMVQQQGCGEQVSFTGQLGRSDLIQQLTQRDICVQPSLTEGFSKAWLDAMVCGLPVITSEVGAAHTIIGESGERGWLVPPGDPVVLSETLYRVLTESHDWHALRQRCRTFAESHTLEDWAMQIGQICSQQWNISFSEGKLLR